MRAWPLIVLTRRENFSVRAVAMKGIALLPAAAGHWKVGNWRSAGYCGTKKVRTPGGDKLYR
jgi:hypothetical protein